MTIHLRESLDGVIDYKIKRESLKKIDYFEDLLIAEADRLILNNEYAKAFEHLLLVKSRNPTWKGLDERVDSLLFKEGAWALIEQDRERGVRLLRELSARRPDYKELNEKLAVAYGGRINEAYDKGYYAYARKILRELEIISPKNSAVGEAKVKLTLKARRTMDDAMKLEGPQRLQKLVEVLRIWPTYEGAEEKYKEAFAALPTLDVAVLDVPRPTAPWVRSPAGERVTKLLYLPILANESEDAVRGKPAGQLAAGLEIGDIGKKLEIRLKPTEPTWSDGTRPVGAIDVVRALTDRAQPRSPGYSARWADLLDRVEIAEDQAIVIKLTRPILRPEAWLLNPVGPAHAAWDGRVSSADGTRKPVGDGAFIAETEADELCTYEVNPKALIAPDPTKLKRIREVRLPSAAAIVSALTRGEVSLAEHVPADRVNGLRQDPEIKVGAYNHVSLHRLAVDGRNPVLRSRNLRRAIAYAIDRRAILEETLLRRPVDALNAPSDGPMATDSYANAPNLPPYRFDMGLARMLVAGAKTELKSGPIKLTLEYPATPEAQAAVPRIADMLRTIGVDIVLVERSETELEESLRSGRKFELAYRSSRCIEPVWEIGPMLCPGFDAPTASEGLSALASSRIMQLLLQLEQAPDWNSAKELVVQIDRESRDELPVIPLWQLQDHYAYRTRLKGPADSVDHLYQGIDQWQIEPWFAKDPQ